MVETILLTLAFSAGFVSFLNPCGFIVLPAYISHLFTRELKRRRPLTNLLLGLEAGGVASLGVVALFAIIGAAIVGVSRAIAQYFPWVNVALGLILIAIGLALLAGLKIGFVSRLHAVVPKGRRRLLGFFQYGLVYAAGSFGCTLPVFISVVVAALTSGSFVDGLYVFLAYSVGMSVPMITVSTAVLTAQQPFVNFLHRIMARINAANAAIIMMVGVFLLIRNLQFLKILP